MPTAHGFTANARPTVIEAYSRSLRLVFISAIAMFVIVNALVFTIKLPHLKKKEASSEDGEENET
jgi:fucose permease